MPEGDWQKTFTMLTIIIHFLHPLLCVANYLDWVRFNSEELGDRRVNLYLAGTIIACVMYLLVASVFYMWAYRWPLPEEYAQKRRIYGVIVNLIFSDVPLFAIEVDIVWQVGIASSIQGVSFVFTCISFAYSAIRTWIYVMITVIKATKPPQQLGGIPTAVAVRDTDYGGIRQRAPYQPNEDGFRAPMAPTGGYDVPLPMSTPPRTAGIHTADIQQRGISYNNTSGAVDYSMASANQPSYFAAQANPVVPGNNYTPAHH